MLRLNEKHYRVRRAIVRGKLQKAHYSSYMLKLERSWLAEHECEAVPRRTSPGLAARPPMASISNSAKEEGSTAAAIGVYIAASCCRKGPYFSLFLNARLPGLHGLSWAQCSGGLSAFITYVYSFFYELAKYTIYIHA